MPDRQDKLRDMLQRRAAAVTPRTEPPPGMLRRARRRIARNGAAALIVLATSVGGIATVVRLVQGPPHGVGIASGGSVPPSGAHPRTCQVKDLTASLDLNGYEAELKGSVVLTKKGAGSCTLEGTPTVIILDRRGDRLAAVQMAGQPWWAQGPSTPPPGWPAVTLSAGGRARVRVLWVNWCTRSEVPQIWTIRLPGTAGTVQAAVQRQLAPGCTDPSSPSTIEVGPFEPYASGH